MAVFDMDNKMCTSHVVYSGIRTHLYTGWFSVHQPYVYSGNRLFLPPKELYNDRTIRPNVSVHHNYNGSTVYKISIFRRTANITWNENTLSPSANCCYYIYF